jgi:hypothetical protein
MRKKRKMKKLNVTCLAGSAVKTLTALFFLMTVSAAAFAGDNDKVKSARTEDFTITQFDKNKVLIACDVKAQHTNEYYEIERSADNKTFTTVGVLFPATEEEMPMRNGLALKDKVADNHTTYYYRLKKVSGENVTYSYVKTIALK